MPAITADQILMASLSSSVVLLTAVIKFSFSGVIRRIDTLEISFKEFAEKVMALGFSDKAAGEKIERLEDAVQDLKMRQHEISKVVTVLKLTQERCRTCTPRD